MYRARTLLIPADLLRDDAVVQAINAALAPVGMSIVLPDLDSRQARSGGVLSPIALVLRSDYPQQRADVADRVELAESGERRL